MAIKKTFYFCLLLSSSLVWGQDKKAEDCETPLPGNAKDLVAVTARLNKKCPDVSKLGDLCGAVGFMESDKDPNSSYLHSYQRKVYEAACADYDNDSDEEISRKVNILWNSYPEKFKCSNTSFDVPQGSILKFAVAKRFQDFIVDAAQIWKVDLNKVDPSDGRTLLDYVKKELDQSIGTAGEKHLRLYYSVLRQAGAKYKSEL